MLLTTSGNVAYNDFAYDALDILLVGSETKGSRGPYTIELSPGFAFPMAPGARSLNVVVAAAMVLGEALRQTHTLPHVSD